MSIPKTTTIGKLNLHDLAKGLILAVGTSVVGGLYAIINNGTLPTKHQLIIIGCAALNTTIVYLFKNLLTNSNDQFLTKEPS